MGRGQRQRQRAMRRAIATYGNNQYNSFIDRAGPLANSSIFITPTTSNVRPPSVLGGGFSFDSVETPFHFDQGSLVSLDDHAVFYSIHESTEYSRLVEEYKSYKVAYLTEDIGEMAIRFYQKHPYLLHVAFDVGMLQIFISFQTS